jgi:hypothetical protein
MGELPHLKSYRLERGAFIYIYIYIRPSLRTGTSIKAIKKTGYQLFTALSQGTADVLKDPEAQHLKEGIVVNIVSSESASVPQVKRGAAETKEEIPLSIKFTSADQKTPSKGTWSDERKTAKEEGMGTDSSPSENKE